MSARFVGGNSTSLRRSPVPFTTYPFTIGMWLRSLNSGVNRGVCGALVNSSNARVSIRIDSSDVLVADATTNTGTVSTITGATAVVGSWYYVLYRGVSATSRYFSTLTPTGNVFLGSNTDSRNPGTLARFDLGRIDFSSVADLYFSGDIAEFFVSDKDVFGRDSQNTEEEIRKLAYEGPFAMGFLDKIVEYRSFKYVTNPLSGTAEDIYINGPASSWTNTDVSTGLNPPLPYNYIRPTQVKKQLII